MGCDFENCWGNSPTCPKFNTHKKVVLHFFIPMLLLPKTPTLIYLKLKKNKGPKTHSLHFTFTSLSLSLHFTFTFTINFRRVVPRTSLSTITFVESTLRTSAIDEHGKKRSIAGIKESFKVNAARARLARG